MEERKPDQDPEADTFRPGEIQQHTKTSRGEPGQSERERALIKDGQARAKRDQDDLNRHGFGGHIGSE